MKLYILELVFQANPSIVRTSNLTTKEFSEHFGRLIKLSTGCPFRSVRNPPPYKTETSEVYSLIADSETVWALKSGWISQT